MCLANLLFIRKFNSGNHRQFAPSDEGTGPPEGRYEIMGTRARAGLRQGLLREGQSGSHFRNGDAVDVFKEGAPLPRWTNFILNEAIVWEKQNGPIFRGIRRLCPLNPHQFIVPPWMGITFHILLELLIPISGASSQISPKSVSYTHLTLPTIYSV